MRIPVAKYVGSRQCDIPITQRYPEADAGTIIPFAIATILFIIRMATKTMHLGGGWGPDDYTLTIAYVRRLDLVTDVANLDRRWQLLSSR